jgi:hypothetical protein
MRLATIFSGVAAIAAVAANLAQAQQTFVYGVYMDAGEGTPNTTNPEATTNGAVWINTGSGPQLMANDVNAQLLVWDTDLATPVWTVLNGYPTNGQDSGTPATSTLLLTGPSDPDIGGGPTASGDITDFGPGIFYDANGSLYSIPGATGDGLYQFQLLMWTGTSTTYAAAVGQPNTYTGQSGRFTANAISGIELAGLPNDTYGQLTNMAAIILQEQLAGDANGDGKVDINDLTIVLANYGQSGLTWSQGCMNFDPSGAVDINDLTIVLANYGHTAGASAIGAVPEPGVLLLLALALTGLLARAARRRRP